MGHDLKVAKGHTDIKQTLLEEEVLDISTTEVEVAVTNSSTIFNVVLEVYQMLHLVNSSSFINRPNISCTINSLQAMKAVSILSTHSSKIRLLRRNTNTVNRTITPMLNRVSKILCMSSIDFNSSMNINFICYRDSKSLNVGCSSTSSFRTSSTSTSKLPSKAECHHH